MTKSKSGGKKWGEVFFTGIKLLWLGLTIITALKAWNPLNIPAIDAVGAVIMIIGLVLFLLDK